jgi:GT2 family glycosyltransferase
MGPAVVVIPGKLTLEVVLATCNGAAFLDPQLESLWRQQRRPDRVLVFDDSSSDDTPAILQRWQRQCPGWLERIRPACDQPQRLGPAAAFNQLLLASRAPYVALCDQDDLWFPERLATGLCQLQDAETRHGSGTPLLLHSDAQLIDASGHRLAGSLWHSHRCQGTPPGLVSLAQHNQVTGCTVLMNRALLQRALPIPAAAVFHDSWLALVARHGGELLACPEQLLAHRRHGSNSSDGRGRRGASIRLAWQRWQAKQRQRHCFCSRYQLSWRQRLTWWPQMLITFAREARRQGTPDAKPSTQ